MGMREEIEALPCCCGEVKLSEVLRIVDKHSGPVVDMTKGGVLRIPILSSNKQDDADLAAILAEHDRKKNRMPL